jgi:hypothetical protein
MILASACRFLIIFLSLLSLNFMAARLAWRAGQDSGVAEAA